METKPTYSTTATLPCVERMTWTDVMRRLQGIGAKVPSGAATVTVTILILDGEPAQWFEPCVQRLEPRRAADQFVRQVAAMGETG